MKWNKILERKRENGSEEFGGLYTLFYLQEGISFMQC